MFNLKIKLENQKLKDKIRKLEEDIRFKAEEYTRKINQNSYQLSCLQHIVDQRTYRIFEIDFVYKKEIITAIHFTRGEGGYYFHGDVGVIAHFIFEGIFSIVEITKETYEKAAE